MSESFVNTPPLGIWKDWIFEMMLPLYFGSLVARSTICCVKIQAPNPMLVKISATTTKTAESRPMRRSMRVTRGESKKVSSAASDSGIRISRPK